MLALLLGIVIFCAGFLWWRKHKKFFKDAILVPGTISSYTTYESKGEHGPTTMYTPIISFEFDGQLRTVAHPISSSSKPEIGKTYQVGVNPYNIEEARVYFKGERTAMWVLIAVGLALLLLGIASICGKI